MFHAQEKYRVKEAGIWTSDESYGNNGAFIIPGPCGSDLRCIVSDGAGWEHVSVSTQKRCPNWKEMCMIKEIFWDDEDVVIQYHPKKSEYINNHPYCLHLWRPIGVELPTPHKNLVGI